MEEEERYETLVNSLERLKRERNKSQAEMEVAPTLEKREELHANIGKTDEVIARMERSRRKIMSDLVFRKGAGQEENQDYDMMIENAPHVFADYWSYLKNMEDNWLDTYLRIVLRIKQYKRAFQTLVDTAQTAEQEEVWNKSVDKVNEFYKTMNERHRIFMEGQDFCKKISEEILTVIALEKGHKAKEKAQKLMSDLKSQDLTQQKLLKESRGTEYSYLRGLQEMDHWLKVIEKAASAAANGNFEDQSLTDLFEGIKTFFSLILATRPDELPRPFSMPKLPISPQQ